MGLNIQEIRNDFPILAEKVYGKPLVYFDNAATTQKPLSVIEAEADVYRRINSNIHRSVHHLGNLCTEAFEEVRKKVAGFINAGSNEEIIFTKGTTESINLLATSLGEHLFSEGDEVILTEMEHHSNIVPWQLLQKRKGIHIKVVPVTDDGELDMDAFGKLFSGKTKIVSVTHISNVMGTINPVGKMIEKAHAFDVPVIIDGAQAIHHLPVDVQKLDCDFYVFSAHKMYGPTGVGILYGKREWLEKMEPYQGGGEMIDKVSFSGTTFNELPYKFEAGTPNFAGVIALGAALEYLESKNLNDIWDYEHDLFEYGMKKMKAVPGIRLIGQASDHTSVISFLLGKAHPFDVGTLLDKLGFALRTGHHCAQPLMDRFGIPGTVRASFAFYNTRDEIDRLVGALNRVGTMLE
ncbi:MAG: cysteine desulfurase CsdA [Anaerophaga sp.]|uniref:aminotransferase class V-fold PLP-dependent enzyme n=1 Tax=Anaerophaga thermohalophila TaxID=177400 RepID=UPI000237C295|nr:cysteine desulfurase [Anaerophaga thermohalophila]MBZ4675751.1 cysteine desulfurase CsdA [Anaerophaga sp.]MDK2840980.1 cysteine desulfurase / selenocysteine lyase [Anaerophaga sp.]MDN5292430.1 cysteine desulfurase / selenocysteine lyase [Anaerophaga sp.]